MVSVSISGCGLDTDTCGLYHAARTASCTLGRYKALLLLLPINHTIQSWHRQPATSFCPPPRTSCTSPHIFVYYQLASKYFNDKYLQQRWSQCPHQCPPHTCHVSSLVTRLPAFGVTHWRRWMILTPNRFFTPNRLLCI